jgi:hypothetical protein
MICCPQWPTPWCVTGDNARHHQLGSPRMPQFRPEYRRPIPIPSDTEEICKEPRYHYDDTQRLPLNERNTAGLGCVNRIWYAATVGGA